MRRKLIRGAAIVSMDAAIGDLRKGDVLIEQDRIVAVAPSIEVSDAEIVDAARRAITSGVRPEDLDEQLFASFLYTAGQPDPDLLIRTSGEMRVSNYLLWQIAYSEIYVTDTLWPDFRRRHLIEAVLAYQKRERRYGGISSPAVIGAK
jgi:undecaprenyl diphosphate synthase